MSLLLLDYGADINYRFPDSGATLLFYAAVNNKTNCLKPLIDRGADINFTDNNGNSILDAAISCGHTEIVQLLQEACLQAKQ